MAIAVEDTARESDACVLRWAEHHPAPPSEEDYAAHDIDWVGESAAVLTTTVSQDADGAVRDLQIVRTCCAGTAGRR